MNRRLLMWAFKQMLNSAWVPISVGFHLPKIEELALGNQLSTWSAACTFQSPKHLLRPSKWLHVNVSTICSMAGYHGLVFPFLHKLLSWPLYTSLPLFQFLKSSWIATPGNIIPNTGPTGGNSTWSATGFIPLLLAIVPPLWYPSGSSMGTTQQTSLDI